MGIKNASYPTPTTACSRRAFVASAAVASLAAVGLLAGCSAADAGAPADGGADAGASASDADNPLGLVVPGKLTIGSDCDYPPFVSMDGEQPQGFEYDLLVALADAMDLELSYLAPQNFDTLVPSIVTGGKMDLAASSVTITDERLEQVDFSEPYFDSNLSLTVMADAPYTSGADLDGLSVGVQSGTTGEYWVKENLTGATVVPFNDQSSAFAALTAGKVEAICIDLPVAAMMIESSYPDCKLLEEIATGEQYGFAVSKDNAALREAVDAALQQLHDDGTYDELYARYEEYFTLAG